MVGGQALILSFGAERKQSIKNFNTVCKDQEVCWLLAVRKLPSQNLPFMV
jgi:hypothetical protein